jgi:hypothetical protein
MGEVNLQSIPWRCIPRARRCRVLAALLGTKVRDLAAAIGISTSLFHRLVSGKQKDTPHNEESMEKIFSYGIPKEVFTDEAPEECHIDWAAIPRKARGLLWFAIKNTDIDFLAKQTNICRVTLGRVIEGRHTKKTTPYYVETLVAAGLPREMFL